MKRINLMAIVRIFCVIFIYFMPLSDAKLIIVIQIEPSSGGYVILQAEKGATARFLERNFAADESGFIAIGFARDVAGQHEIEVTDTDGVVSKQPVWIYSRKYQIQHINGVDQSRVTPPKSVADRIIREAQWVTQARAGQSNLTHWREETFIWPAQGRISGVYGSARTYNGVEKSPHWGIDIAVPKGTAVLAPAGGVVSLAEPDLYFSGGTLVVDHGGGLTSSFLHLSKLNVRLGERVLQGQKIAEVGSTGRSTGAHLDWRMNLHGERIDAALWVSSTE